MQNNNEKSVNEADCKNDTKSSDNDEADDVLAQSLLMTVRKPRGLVTLFNL